MRILFDVTHPAHVHLFRPLAERITAEGGEVMFVGRRKDLAVELLEAFSLPHFIPPSRRSGPGSAGDALEFAERTGALRRTIHDWGPEVLLTRNPTGAVAGLGTRTWTVFDTDDGRTVGLHYWAARPFADVITSSIHDPEDHGRRHRRYRSLKALGFLSPPHFVPDPAIRDRYGAPDGPLFVVRLSRHDASHDRRIIGIDSATRTALLHMLLSVGHVVLSMEGQDTRLHPHRTDGSTDHEHRVVRATDFHHLLAAASLCVGDSQSVAAEAAVLGVPVIRLSGFTGRTFYLTLLEEQYGLIRNYRPGEEDALLSEVRTVLDDLAGARADARDSADRLRAGTEDLIAWFYGLITELSKRRKRPPSGPRVVR